MKAAAVSWYFLMMSDTAEGAENEAQESLIIYSYVYECVCLYVCSTEVYIYV